MSKKEIIGMVKKSLRRWNSEMVDTLVLTKEDRVEGIEMFSFKNAIRFFLDNNIVEMKEVDEDCLSFKLESGQTYFLEIM